MALLKKDKKEEAVEAASVDTKTSAAPVADPKGVIISPRITEKAALASDANVYTFEVARNATKTDIAKAIKSLYKVTPVKVRVAKIPYKPVTLRYKRGTGKKGGGKKAMVYLKKGDSITLM
jgi:large subunit ribosomal protein L23